MEKLQKEIQGIKAELKSITPAQEECCVSTAEDTDKGKLKLDADLKQGTVASESLLASMREEINSLVAAYESKLKTVYERAASAEEQLKLLRERDNRNPTDHQFSKGVIDSGPTCRELDDHQEADSCANEACFEERARRIAAEQALQVLLSHLRHFVSVVA